ncbi:MAG: CTP-dependent riboflavin kinase [Candidatus Aenigmarchaeota archaeon]|nr:CTP-dependent riboflavin kinase [Candidatus Aenigmarchaeota archaeon]
MKCEMFDVLVELAKKKTRVTTLDMAKRLGSSQQTMSRKIRELESLDLIERETAAKGQFVSLTDEGAKFIRKKYLELREIVERPKTESIAFGGVLVSGSGEGRYYVGQDEYFLQFHEKLGFRPFLGTLNVRLKTVQDVKAKDEMENMRPITIRGFKKDNRAFGDIRSYPCMINRKARGAVIIPERTHHATDIVEIIASEDLRKSLCLKEDDYVHVEIRI